MPKQWDLLTAAEKERLTNLQLVAEESMLTASELAYWDRYDVAPDEAIPEQRLIDTCAELMTPFYQEWIDTIAQNKKTPAWAYPLFALGASKMADITLRVLIREWFTSAYWDQKYEHDLFALPQAQHVAKAITDMAVDIIGYQMAKQQFRDDWMKQSHYQKVWSPKRCKAFAMKMGTLVKGQYKRKQREDFGHHMLRIAELTGVIELKNHRTYTGKRWMERVLVTFSEPILKNLTSAHQDVITQCTMLYRPMLVPPVKHTTESSGGHLMPFVRKPMVQRFCDRLYDEKQIQRNSTPSALVVRGLNALMHTEFAINTRVLEVMDNLFHTGTMEANLPAYDFKSFDFSTPYPVDGTKEEQAKWCSLKEEMYSTWYKTERARGRMLVRLSLAKQLSKYKAFYHVFTLDFRGRANAACDLLSPQAGDFDRSLIQIANAQPQTAKGLYWLKVHVANLFDMDKGLTFDQRAAWVDENMQMFQAINDDPYANRALWVSDKKKKNPSFQRLAAVFDLCRTDGLTSLPPQMDGSCNGVQHWAAIMRDPGLAVKVNLADNELPEDLYQFVADNMTTSMELVMNDNSTKGTWATRFLLHWDWHMPRAVCKRSVMTDPYGITFYGIRKYARSEGHLDWVSKEELAAAVMELSLFIFNALNGVLSEPNKGKTWLKEVAEIYAKANKHLEWTTPCGFHVVHEYNEIKTRRSIAKLFNSKELTFGRMDKKQLDEDAALLAIAPNFIHSLDASHMWRTIDRMVQAGIEDFWMVHDSYGCLAPDVPLMREFTVEEFYNTHKDNQLVVLYEQLKEANPDIDIPLPPEVGTFDITQVRKAKYLFQ